MAKLTTAAIETMVLELIGTDAMALSDVVKAANGTLSRGQISRALSALVADRRLYARKAYRQRVLKHGTGSKSGNIACRVGLPFNLYAASISRIF